MKNHQTIGNKIVALRKAKGVTQAELGTYLNISYQAVSKWERDESCPDFQTLSNIAKYFGVPITYFEDEADGENDERKIEKTTTSSFINVGEKMLGVCKDCGKVIYEGNEGETTPVLICKPCRDRKAAMKVAIATKITALETAAKQKEIDAKKKERDRACYEATRGRDNGLIWGCVAAAIVFLLMLIGVFNAKKAEVGGAILGGIILTVLAFTYVSQLFWDGAVVSCSLAGGHIIGTPGVIFEFSLDGFLFLIGVKILFAIIRFAVYLLSLAVCVIAAIVISPITFFFALSRMNGEIAEAVAKA